MQTSFKFRVNGGARIGAGRPKGRRVSHGRRPSYGKHHPLLITLRAVKGAPNLRGWHAAAALGATFKKIAAAPKWTRVIEFSIQRDHLHLIVEAEDQSELSRGMQSICVQLARAVNKRLGRK